MRWAVVITLILISLAAQSQSREKQVLLYGTVKASDGTTLNGTHLKDMATNGNATIADEEGIFSLLLQSLPALVEVSYVGYKKQVISIGKKDLQKDNDKILLTIELVKETVELSPLVVTPQSKVETVFDPYKAYLFDYLFTDGKLLLLVSEGGQRRLQLLDENNTTLFKQTISQAVFEFKEDCLGNFHLLGEDSAYQVTLDVDLFILFAGMRRNTFEDKLKACVVCKDETCILKAFRNHNQTEVFYKTNLSGSPTDSIYAVTDKATKKFNEGAYESILAQAGIDPRFAADIDLNRLNVSRQLEQEIWFYQKILTKPVFCPMLWVNEHFCLFDHVNNELVFFDKEGRQTKLIPSSYNSKKKAGLKEIIANDAETKAFALFIKAGIVSLEEIDLAAGNTKETHLLSEHRFPEKVKVQNGYAYYLYKELGFEDKHRLYRQKLD